MKQHGQTETGVVEYKLAYHQKTNADFMVGATARKFISLRETNGLRRQVQIYEFFSSVHVCFVTMWYYSISKLLLSLLFYLHPSVDDLRIVSITRRLNPLVSSRHWGYWRIRSHYNNNYYYCISNSSFWSDVKCCFLYVVEQWRNKHTYYVNSRA